jgi:uncharacterized coiled-coil DUF342 family protein
MCDPVDTSPEAIEEHRTWLMNHYGDDETSAILKALAAERDEANRVAAIYQQDIGCVEAERDAARAEAARLREALRRIAETRWDAGAADACLTMIRSDARAALAQKEPRHDR